jgi:flagellar biosynthesis protein FlhF
MNLVKMKQLLQFNRYKPEYALTISASTKVKEIQKIFKNFDLFDFNSIIITKLDECDIIGGILNSAIELKKSLRYLTDGQRVPNDIEKVNKINLMTKVKGLELEVYMNNV